jgi:hypothetical protein
MLIKLPEWLTRNKNILRPHQGRVVANTDPSKIGRIKVVIEEFLTVDDVQNKGYKLPWIYPLTSYFLGGSSNAIMFSVPEIGSKVTVVFPFEDIYFGFYTGHWHSTAKHPVEFDEDYPNSFGWRDSTGTYQRVNKTQQYIETFHVSGARIRIYNDGKIEIFTPGKIDFVNSDDVDVETAGSINIQADGIVNINAIETNVNKLIVGDGASGVFTAQSGQVVTVQNGIVIGIV